MYKSTNIYKYTAIILLTATTISAAVAEDFVIAADEEFAVSESEPVSTGEEPYFSYTELQIHAEFDRRPAGSDIWTATLEHFSKWEYGDNFFFVDIESKPDFESEADLLYFEYAARFSFDKIFGKKILPEKYLGDIYSTIQYNDSDRNFINRAWMYGISIDFAGLPNSGFANVHFLVREEATQDTAYQLILFGWQPFSIGNWHFIFKGHIDYWKDDVKQGFLTEPQLRFPLSNIVGKGHLLSNIQIATEVEISSNLFSKNNGWEVNPTIFVNIPLF